MRTLSGTFKYSSSAATCMFLTMDLPTRATLRLWATAEFNTCWTLWTWEEKLAITTFPLVLEITSSITGPMSFSRGVKPGTSALVESTINRSKPSAPSLAKAAKSVRRLSKGNWSILKSPVCRTVPAAVLITTASASGMLWFTAMNSKLKGFTCCESPSRTILEFPKMRCSFSFASKKARVSWEPNIGISSRILNKNGTPPMWSSCPWVSTNPTMSSSRSCK